MSSTERKSPVWQFFDIGEAGKAKCKKCQNFVKTGSCLSRNMNTTNLWNHMKLHHISDYQALSRKCEKSDQNQQTLPGFLEQHRKWANEDARSKKLDELIMEMIAADDQPFSIVEDVGFKRLIQHLEPRYNIKTEKFFRTQKFKEIYTQVEAAVKRLLSGDFVIAFTTDCWSGQTESLMSLTAHWITENFERVSVVLNVKPVNSSHTGDYLKNEFFNMLQFWNIDEKRVALILRDGGANIVKAMKLTDYPHLSCMAHTLQLIVNEGLSSQRTVKDILANLKRIAGHFGHSTLAKHRLRNIQVDLGLPQHSIVQCVNTRWNSALQMVKRLTEQRRAINIYCHEYENTKLPTLTNEQWEIASKIIEILNPVEELTLEFSHTSSSVSCVIPCIQVLKLFLEDKETSDAGSGVKTMIRTMIDDLNKRFSNIEDNKWVVLGCFLDPRFKAQPFKLVTTTLKKAKDWLTEEVKSSTSGESAVLNKKVVETDSVSEVPVKKRKLHSDLDKIYEKMLQTESQGDNEDNGSLNYQTISQEIELYLKDPLIGRKEDPLAWWRSNGCKYKELRILARKYLCAPPSSVASERAFSVVGNIYDDKRNRLKGENAEKLTFLHYNLKFLNFKY